MKKYITLYFLNVSIQHGFKLHRYKYLNTRLQSECNAEVGLGCVFVCRRYRNGFPEKITRKRHSTFYVV